ncbi:Probable aminopyrimidine aminohydrolase-mitochondrial [Striga hermonthica]|uniref:Probable aminopyrimidine aminohydrolase-mitochondrial n=1 Tax=Striga hermonthica TaxID=68872 RepID=A0A9N7MRY3_STRHE|nr:Probable aminopyrimidine aminohydrolase-mitochondrial [Striga hermonthica]
MVVLKQNLLYFLKTLSPPSLNFHPKPSSTPPTLYRFIPCLRSHKSASKSGCSTVVPMSSSATIKLPAPPLIEDGQGSRFWIKFRKEWTQALYTPFMVCLAAGNLKLDSFRHYIAQDVHFLRAFAKAYEMAEEFADDDDAKVGIYELRKSVLEELKMHDSFVQEWGFELPKENTPNAATVKYTDFLLATASGKVEGVKALGKLDTPFEKTKLAAYTLGALTPCMRLYAFLGKELQAFLDPVAGIHPYKKWIENYSSDFFQASALRTEDLLDKLSVSLTGEELDVIEKLYNQAMKLEINLFLAQPLAQKTVVPLCKEHNPGEHCLMLFSDFDLTCTVVDSSAILAEIAILTAPKSDQSQSANQLVQKSSIDLRSTWAELSKQYTEEYEQCIESVLLPREGVNFDYEGLRGALQQLSDFEKKANLRVIDSGVLKGLNLDDIKRAGERLILQDGCKDFFSSAVGNENLNTNIHVLSYCWCGDLIRSAFSSGGLDTVNVHANEFVYENSLSTGEIVKKVESPIDKVEAFADILNKTGKDWKILSLYIGDSVGDLLCLLEADIGIVIGSSSSLRRVGSHFGVSFVPLFPGLIEKQKQFTDEGSVSSWKGRSGVLYTVSCWAEIRAFILGS